MRHFAIAFGRQFLSFLRQGSFVPCFDANIRADGQKIHDRKIGFSKRKRDPVLLPDPQYRCWHAASLFIHSLRARKTHILHDVEGNMVERLQIAISAPTARKAAEKSGEGPEIRPK
jgi:hypothetical protein